MRPYHLLPAVRGADRQKRDGIASPHAFDLDRAAAVERIEQAAVLLARLLDPDVRFGARPVQVEVAVGRSDRLGRSLDARSLHYWPPVCDWKFE